MRKRGSVCKGNEPTVNPRQAGGPHGGPSGRDGMEQRMGKQRAARCAAVSRMRPLENAPLSSLPPWGCATGPYLL